MHIAKKMAVDLLLSILLLVPALIVATLVRMSRPDCITCGTTVGMFVWVSAVLALQPVFWAYRLPRLKRFFIWSLSLFSSFILYLVLEMVAGASLAMGGISIALTIGFLANPIGELAALAFSYYGVRRAMRREEQEPDVKHKVDSSSTTTIDDPSS